MSTSSWCKQLDQSYNILGLRRTLGEVDIYRKLVKSSLCFTWVHLNTCHYQAKQRIGIREIPQNAPIDLHQVWYCRPPPPQKKRVPFSLWPLKSPQPQVIKDQLNSAPVPCLEGIGWFELTQQLLPCCLSIRCDTLTLGIRAKGTTLSWMWMWSLVKWKHSHFGVSYTSNAQVRWHWYPWRNDGFEEIDFLITNNIEIYTSMYLLRIGSYWCKWQGYCLPFDIWWTTSS